MHGARRETVCGSVGHHPKLVSGSVIGQPAASASSRAHGASAGAGRGPAAAAPFRGGALGLAAFGATANGGDVGASLAEFKDLCYLLTCRSVHEVLPHWQGGVGLVSWIGLLPLLGGALLLGLSYRPRWLVHGAAAAVLLSLAGALIGV